MTNHVFGWKPDLQDQRDYKFSSIRTVVELPKAVDLRNKCSAVEDQGSIGSCTANAAIELLEYLDAVPDNQYVNLIKAVPLLQHEAYRRNSGLRLRLHDA